MALFVVALAVDIALGLGSVRGLFDGAWAYVVEVLSVFLLVRLYMINMIESMARVVQRGFEKVCKAVPEVCTLLALIMVIYAV